MSNTIQAVEAATAGFPDTAYGRAIAMVIEHDAHVAREFGVTIHKDGPKAKVDMGSRA